MLISNDTIIGDLLDNNPELGEILLRNGMHCPGCPSSRGETIAEACETHNINLDELLGQLRAWPSVIHG